MATYDPPAGAADVTNDFPNTATTAVNDVGHGMVVGNIVEAAGAAIYQLAQADTAANCDGAIGVVISVEDVDNYTIKWVPTEVSTPNGDIASMTEGGYTPTNNDELFLSATDAGCVVATAPSGGTTRVVKIGNVADINSGVSALEWRFLPLGITLPG